MGEGLRGAGGPIPCGSESPAVMPGELALPPRPLLRTMGLLGGSLETILNFRTSSWGPCAISSGDPSPGGLQVVLSDGPAWGVHFAGSCGDDCSGQCLLCLNDEDSDLVLCCCCLEASHQRPLGNPVTWPISC